VSVYREMVSFTEMLAFWDWFQEIVHITEMLAFTDLSRNGSVSVIPWQEC